MTKTEMINALARYYKIEPNEDGEYDFETTDWQGGCYIDTYHDGETEYVWLSLANVVEALEDYCDENDDDDYEEGDDY